MRPNPTWVRGSLICRAAAAFVALLSWSILMADPHVKWKAVKGYSIRDITIEVEHMPDGKKRPNYVKEYYCLTAEGLLQYSAYFGGMPIEMNHMDKIEWSSSDDGRKVLGLVQALLADPARSKGLKVRPDNAAPLASNAKVYLVHLTKDNVDLTIVSDNPKTPAFKEIDGAFTALIGAFEKATGRPLNPVDLPQSQVSPRVNAGQRS
jgi:hypothetical protein